jgi:DNA polymerase elongation subunit (family B)
VIYTDTDALMYKPKDHGIGEGGDKTALMNHLIQRWAKEKYGKSSVDIRFDNEGMFTKLLIVGKCHYYGYIQSKKGTKKEIKGMEVKRSSSSKYESYFQQNLIEKILNKEPRAKIFSWIDLEKEKIQTQPLDEVGFPCKIADRKYKNEPIFVRAHANTKLINDKFSANIGESFYYIYVKSMGKDKSGKDINVLAFTKEHNDFIDRQRVDWPEVIRRNIDSKAETIFEAIKWKQKNQDLARITLF